MNTSKIYLLLSMFIAAASSSSAQDSYDAQTLSQSDLNGTSRFVGMGGALGALGGDISVMGTNPAGTGLYRKSDAAFTISGVFAGDGAMGHDGSRMSFDQGGLLVAFDMDNPSGQGLQYVNFGVNYQKKRNFLSNLHTSIGGLNNTFSQTFQIADLCSEAFANDYYGTLANLSAAVFKGDRRGGILNEAYYDKDNHFLGSELYDDKNPNYLNKSDEDKVAFVEYEGVGAQKAIYERATYGSNSQTDINLAFNMSDQFFYGLSVGVYDIDYSRESFYQELGVDGNTYDWDNWYKTRGDGFDVKLGFICRPIESSPFRIGAYIHTPIWYRMTDSNGATLYYGDDKVGYAENEEFDYNYRTPWKFGVSLGHTIGNFFAIGAEYEYQDLSTAKFSEIDGYASEYFRYANKVTKETLRGQHTLKIGAEVKPVDSFSIRFGYNFVSSPFKKNAYRTLLYDDPYTETDYTNWGDINRLTFGIGYRYKTGYIDLTYQYQMQKGDFYAFDDVSLKATKISNNRSQLMATFGFRF